LHLFFLSGYLVVLSHYPFFLQPLPRLKFRIAVLSLDEMTGIQALERKAPDLPRSQGKIQRREFEYIRHGTQTSIASFDVAKGQVICSTVGNTRTEADYLSHIQKTQNLRIDKKTKMCII
jgi:hypothetical protein